VGVHVEGVGATVVVYDGYLDNSAIGEDYRIRVHAVNGGVGDEVCGRTQGCVKGWDFLGDVGDVVEGAAVLVLIIWTEIDVKCDRKGHMAE